MFLLRDILLLVGSSFAVCKNQARQGTRECLLHRLDDGKLYRGALTETETGKTCKPWPSRRNAQSFIIKTFKTQTGEEKEGRIPGNFCRNTGRGEPRRLKPWCYTDDRRRNWEYCNVPPCNTEAFERECEIEQNFLNSAEGYVIDAYKSSCVMIDQGLFDELKKGISQKASKSEHEEAVDLINISPFLDCGQHYRGIVNTSETGRSCDHWNRPDSLHKNFGLLNTCRTPDFNFNKMSANSCGEHNTPWCYVKKEKPDDPRFEQCNIPDCSCSKTFLKFTKGKTISIPWDLTPWKSIVDPLTKVDAFLDLIDPWNDNVPCSDPQSCPSMCKTDKSRNRRSANDYDEAEETVGQDEQLSSMRTISGYRNPPGSSPWLVALESTSENSQNKVCQEGWRQFCGGSLIHPLFVVTAAHCIETRKERNPESVTVVAGLSNIDGQVSRKDSKYCLGQRQKAVKIFNHPKFQNVGEGFDISIVQVKKPFWFNGMVSPICLPPVNWEPEPNSVCMIGGWGLQKGTIEGGNKERMERQEVHQRRKFVDSRLALVRHIERDECRCSLNSDNVSGETKILESQICFGHGKVDACQGDSGGPVICKNPNAQSADAEHPFYLTGIVSYGPETTRRKNGESIKYNCGDKSVPGIYTKVSDYLPWIYLIIDQNQ